MKKEHWNEQKILENIKLFYKNNGHFPSAYKIDECNYLPSSRHIQRRFKGLINLRKKLRGIENSDLRKGKSRSSQMSRINNRSLNLENELGKKLIKRFGEPFVHFQKPISNTKRRYDFYVYCKNKKFAIDVFYPAHIKSINNIINIKLKEYPEKLLRIYFICMNREFTQAILNEILNNRVTKLPKNIELFNINYFLDEIIQKYKKLNINY